jgi:pimeloyl-ACP methyl ester carboxylesterase
MNRLGRAVSRHGYAPVNGLNMYYEIEGSGEPLVHIPPAFGHCGSNAFPALAERHSVITVDLQGHGRTADIPERSLSIEQNAEDVVGLLQYLGIAKADFFGESYGGAAAMMIALRHPELVGRVATYGATFGPPGVAHNREMLRFDEPPTADARAFDVQRESYRQTAPDRDYWPQIWQKVSDIRWAGFSREELASIEAPVLIVLGDRDFVRIEHAVDTLRIIPNGELAVIADAGHFALFSEQERVMPVVQHFFDKPVRRAPVATAGMGFHPGESR